MSESVSPPANATTEKATGSTQDLFGRGMWYVAIWSMQMVVSTVVSPILARLLGQEQFGQLALAIALYQLLITVSVFGLDQALALHRVQEDDSRGARALLAAGIVVAFAVTAVAVLTSPLWLGTLGFAGFRPVLYAALAWNAPGAAVLMVLSLLQAEDRLGQFAWIGLLSTVGSQLFGIVLILLLGPSAFIYALGGVIGQTASLVLGIAWTRPRWAGGKDLRALRPALAVGVPLVLSSLAEFALSGADRFIIERFLGSGAVARYQVAFTVGNVLTLILTFTNRAWMPRLAAVEDDEERRTLVGESRDGTYRLVSWALLGVTVSAPVLLRIFAPASFDPGHLVLTVFIVGLGAIPVCASTATARMLISLRRTRPLASASVAAVVVKLLLTFVLLPLFGLPGAALGTVAGLLAQAVWQRVALSRHQSALRSAPRDLILLAATTALAGLSTLLPQSLLWNIARFAFSTACLVPFFLAWRRLQAGEAAEVAAAEASAAES